MNDRSDSLDKPAAGREGLRAPDDLLAQMHAFQAGRPGAFDRLYQAIWKPVLVRAGKMGLAAQECEELAQKVMVRVYLYAPKASFASRQELWSWIYTVTAREVYKAWRQKTPQFISDEGLELLNSEMSAGRADPLDSAEQGEAVRDVGDCIDLLGQPQRLHLLGVLVHGLTFRQAAGLHGLSLGQFKHKYEKALQKVRDCMRAKGHELP